MGNGQSSLVFFSFANFKCTEWGSNRCQYCPSFWDVKGIVHFEINFWYVLAYLKGIQDVGFTFFGQTVVVYQSYNAGLGGPRQRACTENTMPVQVVSFMSTLFGFSIILNKSGNVMVIFNSEDPFPITDHYGSHSRTQSNCWSLCSHSFNMSNPSSRCNSFCE